jgi:hypothetical protein
MSQFQTPQNRGNMSTSIVIRVLSATALAAAAAAILAGILSLSPQMVPIAFIVALPHAALGLVIYFLLRSRWKLTLQSSLIAGFLIGAIPMGILGVVSLPNSASVGGVSTVIGGRLTLAGWIDQLILSVTFGFFGAVAGLVFWLVIRSSPQAIGGGIHAAPSAPSHLAQFLTLAVATVAGIFLIPSLTMDRTCHNSLRDGRTSMETEIGIDLRVGISEWGEFAAILEDYGRSVGWSVRKDIQQEAGVIHSLYVSICDEAGTNISVIEMIFPDSPAGDVSKENLGIAVYQPQGGDSWKAPTKNLVGRLSKRWPGRIWFSGGGGEEVPAPEWLKSELMQ